MAALFYTNHCAKDIGVMFQNWRVAFANAKKSKKTAPKVPAIDTDLVNQR